MLDYLNSESEEVKTALAQLSEAKQALQQARDNYRPSIRDERYLTGEEVCRYLHISPRTLQTLRDTRQIPFTVYQRAGISLSRERNTGNPSQKFTVCRKAFLNM